MSTVLRHFYVDDVLTNVTSVYLSSIDGTFGVKRNDTGTVIVADGTAMVNSTIGAYYHTFIDPTVDLTYTVGLEFTYNGETYNIEYDFDGYFVPVPTPTEVIRWHFDSGGDNYYLFPRNPDRNGGDTFWQQKMRMKEFNVIGSTSPSLHITGFNGATRQLKFSAITGDMMRTLEAFYYRGNIIYNCRDHFEYTFDCVITQFQPRVRPVMPGSTAGDGEDTYDLNMTIMRMS